MKFLSLTVAGILLLSMVSACGNIRKQNPLDVKCPSCGYLWEKPIGPR